MKLSQVLTLLSKIAIIGYAIGVVIFLYYVMVNQYIKYKMYKLVLFALQNYLIKCVLIPFFVSLILLFFSFSIYLIYKSYIERRIKIHFTFNNKYEILFALILCTIFFFYGGWAINHYLLPQWNHPISLIADAGIFLFTLFLAWIILRRNSVNPFSYVKPHIIRRTGFALLLSVAIVNLIILLDARIDPPKGGNVVFVLIDALRADHLGCYGYTRSTSPFLDTLSNRALTFDKVTSQSSWTKTSMASLFTSTYPSTHNTRGVHDKLADSWITLAEIMKQHNYYTVAFQTNPWLRRMFGFNQGFNEYHYLHHYSKATSLNNRVFSWLDKNFNKKFFLYIHYMDVHEPYVPPEEFNRFGTTFLDRYDGEILYIDHSLRALFTKLKSLGIYENTTVIIASDHGEEFREHGGLYHGRTLYQEVVWVPLILVSQDPRIYSSTRVQCLVENNDILPTILHVSGIDFTVYDYIKGSNLLEYLGKTCSKEQTAFTMVGPADRIRHKEITSIINQDFMKYILDKNNETGIITTELYNLRRDPHELHNLIHDEKYTHIRSQLSTIVGDKLLIQRSYSNKQKETFIDEDTRKQLKSLGYLH